MLGALVTAGRDLQEKVTPLLDNLTCQLLALCEYLGLSLYHRRLSAFISSQHFRVPEEQLLLAAIFCMLTPTLKCMHSIIGSV